LTGSDLNLPELSSQEAISKDDDANGKRIEAVVWVKKGLPIPAPIFRPQLETPCESPTDVVCRPMPGSFPCSHHPTLRCVKVNWFRGSNTSRIRECVHNRQYPLIEKSSFRSNRTQRLCICSPILEMWFLRKPINLQRAKGQRGWKRVPYVFQMPLHPLFQIVRFISDYTPS
jgi:hypothetical protein